MGLYKFKRIFGARNNFRPSVKIVQHMNTNQSGVATSMELKSWPQNFCGQANLTVSTMAMQTTQLQAMREFFMDPEIWEKNNAFANMLMGFLLFNYWCANKGRFKVTNSPPQPQQAIEK